MRVGILYTFTCLLVVAAFGGGCASTDKKTADEPKPAMRALGEGAPPGEEVSNETIGPEIRRQLGADPTSTAGIIVEVDDGRVTLRGTAPTLAASWRAQAIANAVKGVKSVVNQIIVKIPTVPP